MSELCSGYGVVGSEWDVLIEEVMPLSKNRSGLKCTAVGRSATLIVRRGVIP